MVFLRLSVAPTTPVFSSADNPIAHVDDALTRALSISRLWALHARLLLFPNQLSFDWSMTAVPLVRTVRDSANLETVLLVVIMIGISFRCYCDLIEARTAYCVRYLHSGCGDLSNSCGDLHNSCVDIHNGCGDLHKGDGNLNKRYEDKHKNRCGDLQNRYRDSPNSDTRQCIGKYDPTPVLRTKKSKRVTAASHSVSRPYTEGDAHLTSTRSPETCGSPAPPQLVSNTAR